MTYGGVLFGQKCVRAMDMLIGIRRNLHLEIAVPSRIKARDLFLLIRKKISTIVNFDITRQTVLASLAVAKKKSQTPKEGSLLEKKGGGC